MNNLIKYVKSVRMKELKKYYPEHIVRITQK